jgi:Ankyrin repeats (many copies)
MNHIHELNSSKPLQFHTKFMERVKSKNLRLMNECAVYGKLEYLAYAHENGCSSYIWTCVYAVMYGYLECLQYLHENGCPWNEYVCQYAAYNGHLKCLRYALTQGCPYDKNDCIGVAKDSEALFEELGL